LGQNLQWFACSTAVWHVGCPIFIIERNLLPSPCFPF